MEKDIVFTPKIDSANAEKELEDFKKKAEGSDVDAEEISKEIAKWIIYAKLAGKAIEMIGEKLGTMLSSSKEITAVAGKLRAAFAVAVQPLYEAAVPALESMLRLVTQIMVGIARIVNFFFLKTFSQSAETAKALDKQTAKYKGVGKAAKEASKALAGFDEINQLANKNAASSGGGGGSVNPLDFTELEHSLTAFDAVVSGCLLALGVLLLATGNVPMGVAAIVEGLANILGTEEAGAVVDANIDMTTRYFDHLKKGLEDGTAWTEDWIDEMFDIWTMYTPDDVKNSGIAQFYFSTLKSLILLQQQLQKKAEEIRNDIIGWINNILGISFDAETGEMTNPILDRIVSWWESVKTWWHDNVVLSFNFYAGENGVVNNPLLFNVMSWWEDLKTWWHDNVVLSFNFGVNGNGDVDNPLLTAVSGWWEDVKSFFSSPTWFASVTESISSAFQTIGISIVNGLIDLFNKAIDAINSLGTYSTIFGDGQMWHFDHIAPMSVPALAQGAVIPPNAPFLAMLGDQRSGTNIEAPESLIRRIVREESGGNDRVVEAINTLIATVAGIQVGDDVIGRAADRYSRATSRAYGR